MWNKTITLYNKYVDSKTEKVHWYRCVLKNCFVKHTINNTFAGNTKNKTDNVIIRIPKQLNFLQPLAWFEKSNNSKNMYMTLQVGDLIVLGDISDEINEYIEGKRSNDIVKKYAAIGCTFITSININTDLPGAHYFVRGD